MPVNDELFSLAVLQQVRYLRLSNAEAKEARKILSRIDAKLAQFIQEINLSYGPLTFSQTRLRQIRAQVKELLAVTHADLKESVTKAVLDATEFSAELELSTLQKTLPIAIDLVTPNLGILRRAALVAPFNGSPLDDWLAELSRNDVNRTFRRLQMGLLEGENTDDLVRGIIGSRSLQYKDGVRDVSKRGVEMLVRTAINHAASMGRQSLWEENADLIKGVRWVSTLDTRTSEICRFRDGTIYPTTEGPRPPAHPNCRSTTVAVTKSWRELGFDIDEMPEGTRASMNGQVPSSQTYYEWLQNQSEEIQREVLGLRRFKMWKDGEVKITDFHNDRGVYLTLDELRQLR